MKTCFLCMNIFAVVLFSNGCAKNQTSVPEWAAGTWEGMLSWEHDIADYPIRLVLNDSTEDNRIEYLSLDCSVSVTAVSASESNVRLEEAPGEKISRCAPFGGGVILLVQVDYFNPGLLHLEYYPEDKMELWLAQIERQ